MAGICTFTIGSSVREGSIKVEANTLEELEPLMNKSIELNRKLLVLYDKEQIKRK